MVGRPDLRAQVNAVHDHLSPPAQLSDLLVDVLDFLGCPSQRLLHRSGKAAGKPAAWLHSARAQKKPRQGAGLVGSIMLAQPTCTRMPNSGKI